MPLTYEQRVLRVLQHIHDYPAEDLSLDRLADVAAMSRFHWHRVFQAMTGETCAQAVRRIRLSLAANWLTKTDTPVQTIASRAGYQNLQSFTRAFSERFGVPPATFRNSGLPGLLPPTNLRGEFTMFSVELDNTPRKKLAAMQHHGNYNDIGACFDQLATLATSEKLWPDVKGMIGVHYDDPNVVDEASLRSHAALWMSDDAAIPDSLEEVVLPESQCAILHYKGPYQSIKVAYDYFYGDWLPRSGKEPADAPPYEIYLNSPADTAEADLLTDIVMPLAG